MPAFLFVFAGGDGGGVSVVVLDCFLFPAFPSDKTFAARAFVFGKQ